MANTADDTIKDAAVGLGLRFPCFGICCDFAKAEGIEYGDRARPHGEDVAQDTADAGGRSLERLDVAWVIVRFDLESGDEALSYVHDTCIFTRSLHDELATRGKTLEVNFAGFVGAVLAPHHGENPQLGDVRIAAENFLNAGVLFGGYAVLGGNFGSDLDFCCCCRHLARLRTCCSKAIPQARKIQKREPVEKPAA